MNVKSGIKFLFAAFALVSIASCGGGGGDGGNSCSILNARIFNGDTCSQTAQTPVVQLVAVFEDGSRIPYCTGSLVTVDDVLTSAHCITSLATFSQPVVDLEVIVGGRDGEAIQIVNGAVHPFYVETGRGGHPYDVGMLTLARVPSPPIGPLPLLLTELTGGGTELTAFGYGSNNENEQFLLKAATFTLSGFDSVGNLVVVGNPGEESSICRGDSGGPAIFNQDGVATLAGVNSYVNEGACQSVASNTFGFVDIQNLAILDFMAQYAPDIPIS